MSTISQNICPSCTSHGLKIFYEVKNIPANSMLSSNYKEATSVPLGDIRLGFCKSCGFISNVDFIPSKPDYASPAPEEQGFSATFNAFIQRIAEQLIKTYSLHNKHILEIGCGRGDFLALLCELGNNFGVGIDPSPVIGKIENLASDRLTFIRDFFSDLYLNFEADLICCRHTLEHIHNTAEFLGIVRRTAKKKLNSVVFFEVPDVTRILNEGAFWDIYYEHCSYFTLGSLARLFRSCKFELQNLRKDYFDQYLLIEAKTVNQKSGKVYEIEESVPEIIENVKNFSHFCQKKFDFWKNYLQQIQKNQKRVVIWGSGSKCIGFMTTLNIQEEIEYIIDINPNRQGRFIPGVGKEIMAPEFLKDYRPDAVIVMNPAYCNEINQMLVDMGVNAKLIPCS
jgi:SAM-dependent methyltransferase